MSSFNAKIYDVNPTTGAVSVLLNASADGLAYDSSAGILYAAQVAANRVVGFDVNTRAMVYNSGTIPGGPDGIAFGDGPVAGNLFVNTNGGTVVEINLATKAQTVIASGGSRGDFVTVDPTNGTLLLTQSDRILRLKPGVFVVPGTTVTTTTTLDATPMAANSGQALTLTAVVASQGAGIPGGTVTFLVNGQPIASVGLSEVKGVDQATFTTSALPPGTLVITAAYGGDSTFAPSGSAPASVTIDAVPTIIKPQVLRQPVRNRKGKPVGKPVVVGFSLEYSTAMKAATAGLPANYQGTYITTAHVQKRRVTVARRVEFQVKYDSSSNVVTLTIVGKPNFTRGGRIVVNATPPDGVSSAAGEYLPAVDTVFSILPKAAAIWPSNQIGTGTSPVPAAVPAFRRRWRTGPKPGAGGYRHGVAPRR